MTDESDRRDSAETEPERGTLDWVIAQLESFAEKSKPNETASSPNARSHFHSEANRLLRLLTEARKDMGEQASEWRISRDGEREPSWVGRLEKLANFDQLDEELTLRTDVRVLGDGIQPIAIAARSRALEASEAEQSTPVLTHADDDAQEPGSGANDTAPRQEPGEADATEDRERAGARFRLPVGPHHQGTWDHVINRHGPKGSRPL